MTASRSSTPRLTGCVLVIELLLDAIRTRLEQEVRPAA